MTPGAVSREEQEEVEKQFDDWLDSLTDEEFEIVYQFAKSRI